MKVLRFIAFLLLAFYSNAIFSKDYEFLWGVDANTVFDNREGDQTYSPQQTIFFSRLSPSVGLEFLDEHRLVVGTHYIQPIGIGYKNNKFIPTAYYTFSHKTEKKYEIELSGHSMMAEGNDKYSEHKHWTVSFGMIPRRLSYRLPEILWSDSMEYYNPNIRGILLKFTKNNTARTGAGHVRRQKIFQNVLSLDWRSLQSAEQREAFNVNYNVYKEYVGKRKFSFIWGGNAQLNHLAKRNPAPEGEGVNDDMFIYPHIGLSLNRRSVLDIFTMWAGYAVSFDRCRAIGDWEIDGGLLANFRVQWKKIGVRETLYVGDRQFPLYPKYGSLLNMGDPHYQSSVYSKTSIYSPIVENSCVSFGASLDFHVTKEGTSCYQKVYLNVNLGNVDN